MWIAGLAAATATVVATTLDDAVWLVPYVGSRGLDARRRALHGAVFVMTLEGLSVASVLLALALRSAAAITASGGPGENSDAINDNDQGANHDDILFACIGATLCWLLALFFYCKKLRKRRRKQQEQEQRMARQNGNEGNPASDAVSNGDGEPANVRTGAAYGSFGDNDNNDSDNNNAAASDDSSSDSSSDGHQPLLRLQQKPWYTSVWTVASLTTLGALDEISYFPALVVGRVFTPVQLCLGTACAALIMLGLVTCCFAQCQPLVKCLDRIPLYGVIALFATILTLEVIHDVLW